MNARNTASIEEVIRVNQLVDHDELTAEEAGDIHAMRDRCHSRSRPFVVRGYAKNWPCVQNWSGDRLVQLAEEEARVAPHRKYKVAEVPDNGLLMLTEGRHRTIFHFRVS